MTPPAPPRLTARTEDGRAWPILLWVPGPGWRMIASAVDGGGLGERGWWLNTQVDRVYHHPDPAGHVREIAAGLGLGGPGVGLLTAADVQAWTLAEDAGVMVAATVGLGLPVYAAASEHEIAAETAPRGPGTINVLVIVPVPMSDAALVNAVITATEAKTQALLRAGIPGTGTSSDAVCIACPREPVELAEPYGGPRSDWGARIARAVQGAVSEGARAWLERHPDGDEHRPWRLCTSEPAVQAGPTAAPAGPSAATAGQSSRPS